MNNHIDRDFQKQEQIARGKRIKNIREVQRLNDINFSDSQPLDEFSVEMESCSRV